MSNQKNGFTLIELLITIVILGLLISIVAPQMFGKVDSSKRKTAYAQLQSFETAINTYRLDVGSFPTSLQELRESSQFGWDGPYLPKSIPLDPWNNSYVYRVPGENGNPFYLASLGKDKAEGGEDDNEDIVLKW
ncbi:MAG: type II secretion system protein GspG [Pseudoalteromonas sp.]|nr:type II secretion system protein GspG [Pseudoalteromonas sp.]